MCSKVPDHHYRLIVVDDKPSVFHVGSQKHDACSNDRYAWWMPKLDAASEITQEQDTAPALDTHASLEPQVFHNGHLQNDQ